MHKSNTNTRTDDKNRLRYLFPISVKRWGRNIEIGATRCISSRFSGFTLAVAASKKKHIASVVGTAQIIAPVPTTLQANSDDITVNTAFVMSWPPNSANLISKSL